MNSITSEAHFRQRILKYSYKKTVTEASRRKKRKLIVILHLKKREKKIIIFLEIPLTYLLENIFKEGAVYGKKR